MKLSERIAAVQRDRALLAEPPPSTGLEHAAVRDSVQSRVIDGLGSRLYDPHIDDQRLAHEVRSAVTDVLGPGRPLGASEHSRIAQEVTDDLLGHGPLEALLRDPDISEIMVNGPHQVFVERSGQLFPVTTQFDDERHLRRTIDKMVSRVGRRVDESSPMVDARLPDGSRLNAILPPLAIDGSALTIRKFAPDPFTIDDLVSMGTLTTAAAEFLAAAVRGRLTLLVSGSTGSGKTTTLNVLSSFIPEGERIVTIEDAAELRLQQQHVVRLESRPPNLEGQGEVTIRTLVRNALRMRPDRIILGEVRDSAAVDMLQAMSTGHDGSIGTVHASSPREALARLETMILLGGADLPLRAVRETMVSALDLIVHQVRGRTGARVITSITEVVGLEGDTITVQEVFSRTHESAPLMPTGIRPRFLDRLRAAGEDLSRVNLTPESDQHQVTP